MKGWIIWPEGRPWLARFAATKFAKNWLLLGPFGFRHSFRGRRMLSCGYCRPDDNPIVVARHCERTLRRWP